MPGGGDGKTFHSPRMILPPGEVRFSRTVRKSNYPSHRRSRQAVGVVRAERIDIGTAGSFGKTTRNTMCSAETVTRLTIPGTFALLSKMNYLVDARPRYRYARRAARFYIQYIVQIKTCPITFDFRAD